MSYDQHKRDLQRLMREALDSQRRHTTAGDTAAAEAAGDYIDSIQDSMMALDGLRVLA